MDYLTLASRTQLSRKLDQTFGEDELRTLCFDLGLDYENIPGDTRQAHARELVRQVERLGRVPDLLAQCKTQRPNVDWAVTWTHESPVELNDDPTHQVIGADSITVHDVGGNVNINKRIIQIGRLEVPRGLAWMLLALVAAGVVGIVLIATRVLAPEPRGPTKMSGTFNIAVAQFPQANEQGELKPSPVGEQLSAGVFDALKNQRERYKEVNPDAVVWIWQDSLPKVEKGVSIGYLGDTVTAQDKSVIDTTQAISANLMIYGYLQPQGGFVPEFYVPPTFRGSSELMGRYRLGDQPVPTNQGKTSEELTTRANAMFLLAMGLAYEDQGEQAKALDVFRQAEQKLKQWSGKAQGKEILFFFIGQSSLFLAQQKGLSAAEAYSKTVEAEDAFSKSLSINPDFIRARIGLGSVFLVRVQQQMIAGVVDDAILTPLLSQMGAAYQEAERLAPQSTDRIWAQGVMPLALGQGFFVQGLAQVRRGLLADAERTFEAASQRMVTGRAVLEEERAFRLLAQIYQSVGSAQAEKAKAQVKQNKTDEAKSSYSNAMTAFEACIAQGKNQSTDKTLADQIVQTCVDYKAKAAQALQRLK
jgi:tetratricopeptide (TPR) repeat protein